MSDLVNDIRFMNNDSISFNVINLYFYWFYFFIVKIQVYNVFSMSNFIILVVYNISIEGNQFV